MTSLPSPYGIGDVGPAAFQWVDRLHDAGQRWWQALVALDLLLIAAEHRLQGGGGSHQRLRVDIRREVRVFGYRVHWYLLAPFGWPSLRDMRPCVTYLAVIVV